MHILKHRRITPSRDRPFYGDSPAFLPGNIAPSGNAVSASLSSSRPLIVGIIYLYDAEPNEVRFSDRPRSFTFCSCSTEFLLGLDVRPFLPHLRFRGLGSRVLSFLYVRNAPVRHFLSLYPTVPIVQPLSPPFLSTWRRQLPSNIRGRSEPGHDRKKQTQLALSATIAKNTEMHPTSANTGADSLP